MIDETTLRDTVQRLLSDESYADEVRSTGLKLLQEPSDSATAQEYFKHFGLDPDEAAGLIGSQSAENCTCNSNTFITITSATTPICGGCCAVTTTTTTSG